MDITVRQIQWFTNKGNQIENIWSNLWSYKTNGNVKIQNCSAMYEGYTNGHLLCTTGKVYLSTDLFPVQEIKFWCFSIAEFDLTTTFIHDIQFSCIWLVFFAVIVWMRIELMR